MTTRARVLTVPFDGGSEGLRMGAGPDALVAAGLPERLRDFADRVDVVPVTAPDGWRSELQTTFELHRELLQEVRRGLDLGAAQLVLAGDCNMTVGAVAAHHPHPRTGVVWFDAHADMNTPETDVAGYLDGQGLAMLTGRCWAAHTRDLEGFAPVPDRRVLLVGARAIDELETEVLRGSDIARMSPDEAGDTDARTSILDAFLAELDQVHVHVDADVLDPGVGVANDYAAPGGLQVADVESVIQHVAAARPVVTATIASWDPVLDDGRLCAALMSIASTLTSAMLGRAG